MANPERFVKCWGYALLVCAALCLYLLWLLPTPPFPFADRAFGAAITALYLILGVGWWRRARWAYRGLAFLLYVSFVAFPIGTAISYFSLRYMRRHHVADLFR
jgi:hypothetical protein